LPPPRGDAAPRKGQTLGPPSVTRYRPLPVQYGGKPNPSLPAAGVPPSRNVTIACSTGGEVRTTEWLQRMLRVDGRLQEDDLLRTRANTPEAEVASVTHWVLRKPLPVALRYALNGGKMPHREARRLLLGLVD
jgi:hypothetical protein